MCVCVLFIFTLAVFLTHISLESRGYFKETLIFLSDNCSSEFQAASAGLSQDQLQILTAVLN